MTSPEHFSVAFCTELISVLVRSKSNQKVEMKDAGYLGGVGGTSIVGFIGFLALAIVAATFRVDGKDIFLVAIFGMIFMLISYVFANDLIISCCGGDFTSISQFTLSELQVPGFLTAKQNKRSRAARRCSSISAVLVRTLITLLPYALLPALMFGVPETNFVTVNNKQLVLESGEQALFKPNVSGKTQFNINTEIKSGNPCDLHICKVSQVPPKVVEEQLTNFTNLEIGNFQTYAQLQKNGSLFVDFKADGVVKAQITHCSEWYVLKECEGKGNLSYVGGNGCYNVTIHNNDTSKLVGLNLTLKEVVRKFEVEEFMVANKSINVSDSATIQLNATDAVVFQLGNETDGYSRAYVNISQEPEYFMGTHEDSIAMVAGLSCFVSFVCVAALATLYASLHKDSEKSFLFRGRRRELPVCELRVDESSSQSIFAIVVRTTALLAVVAACTTGLVVFSNKRAKLIVNGVDEQEEVKQLSTKMTVLGVLMGLAAALFVLIQVWCSCSVPVDDYADGDDDDKQRQGEEEPLMKTPTQTPTDMKSPAEEETATPAGTGADPSAPPVYTL